MALSVSVSKVDGYLYYMRSEHKTLEEVKADIMGTAEQTEAMRMGQAFHKIFEDARPGMAADTMEVDGFTFHFDGDMEVPIMGVPEVRCQKTYDIDGEHVTVRGRCDRALGREVVDYKMIPRWDESQYVKFQDSFQWRAYLDMLGADQFRYMLFLKRPKKDGVHIVDSFPLLFHRYPGMRNDVELSIRHFLTFVKQHMPDWYREQRSLPPREAWWQERDSGEA